MSIVIALHVLSAVVWVGGMFFVYVCLRPAAGTVLPPAERLRLFQDVLRRFFTWVWAAVILLLVSGFWMGITRFGNMAQWPLHLHLMQGLGILMMLLFLHVFFAPWRRFRRALADGGMEAAARSLNRIRLIVALNLVLGLVVVAVAAGGRYA